MAEVIGADMRKQVAVGCRVIGLDLNPGGGHVSARVPGTDEMLIRCRGGGAEGGMVNTDLHHIRRVDFDGEGPGLGKRHFAPAETPIHGEIYRVRPDVGAVVHSHPHYSMLCSIAGFDLRPIFAAYNTGATGLAIAGVPVYSRGETVIDKEMAAEMIEVMSDRDVLLLKGHGVVTAGRTVEEAISHAFALEALARVTWEVGSIGKQVPEITGADYARYDRRDPNRRVPPPHRGGHALPPEDRGVMVSYVAKLEQTIGLPSWELDEEG